MRRRSCRHTKLWAEGKRTCILCWRIPVQWEASAAAAAENAVQWLRYNGFMPPLIGPVQPFSVAHDLPFRRLPSLEACRGALQRALRWLCQNAPVPRVLRA